VRKVLKSFLRPFLIIISTFLFIIIAGYILYFSGLSEIKPAELTVLSIAFSFVSAITVLIFLKGRDKEEKEGAIHTLVAITIKFLSEIIIAAIWFIPAKKTGMDYILLFFVLYLTFSLCTVIIILNILKKKSL
jgi:drug/metabolite transporter (DMT)-like permease